jgi:hypothetical protein
VMGENRASINSLAYSWRGENQSDCVSWPNSSARVANSWEPWKMWLRWQTKFYRRGKTLELQQGSFLHWFQHDVI